MRETRNVRIPRVAGLALGVGILAVFTLLPTAGATPRPAAMATASTAPNLSTLPGITSYLRSQGVSLKKVVIQRGARNYAGPNCPGVSWNCTRAAGIVVQAAQSGVNRFECTPIADRKPGTVEPTTCVLFQWNVEGNNHATCREGSDATPVATLTCNVTQINANGDNHANIDQKVDQRVGAAQEANVEAFLDQENVSGDNHANLSQSISQSTSQVSVVMLEQSQDAGFDAEVFQDTDTGGNNFLQQSQTLNQDGRASGSSEISQDQFGDHFGHIDQDTIGGESSSRLAGSVGLLQEGSPEGFSKAHVTQTERQTLTGPGSQTQEGPMNCCGAGSQNGSPQQTGITIHQSSTQKASQFGPGAVNEFQSIHGDCRTTGTCTIQHNVTNEADSLNQKVSGTGIQELFTTCEAVSGEGTFGECFAGGGD